MSSTTSFIANSKINVLQWSQCTISDFGRQSPRKERGAEAPRPRPRRALAPGGPRSYASLGMRRQPLSVARSMRRPAQPVGIRGSEPFIQPPYHSCERLIRRGIFLICWSFRMSSIKQRLAAYAAVSANLLTQMNELVELRERVRKAQLSAPRDDEATDAKARLRYHGTEASRRKTDPARRGRASVRRGCPDLISELRR